MPSPQDHAMSERLHFARLNQAQQVRLYNPKTRCFLHLSGKGETKGTTWAWLGWRYQADALKSIAAAGGKSWPYVVTTKSQDTALVT